MHACMLHIVCWLTQQMQGIVGEMARSFEWLNPLVIVDPVMAESSEIQYHEDICVICVDPEVDEKLVRVRKGIDTLIEYSQKRNRITLHEYLCRQNQNYNPRKCLSMKAADVISQTI